MILSLDNNLDWYSWINNVGMINVEDSNPDAFDSTDKIRFGNMTLTSSFTM